MTVRTAHGELGKVQGGKLFLPFLPPLIERPEPGTRTFRVRIIGRDGHQAPDPQTRQGKAGLQQRRNLVGRKPGFALLFRFVDLNQDLQDFPCLPGLAVQFLGQGKAIHGLDHRKQFYRRPGLIPLKVTDEVPGPPAEFFNFFLGLLDIIFPEMVQPGFQCFLDSCGRHGLRYRHQ
jgi:hypothetical protein